MMKCITISQVSKKFHISTRTLRYYEQMGLLSSVKQEEYAYRTYDDIAVRRLQQIIILRKLRIKLKTIATILQNDDAVTTIEVFQENLKEVNDEITALTTIKSILQTFIDSLSENINFDINSDLFSDDSIMKIVDSLTLSKINFKEERSMEELNKASVRLSKLKDVRIVFLPPMTVASYQYLGDEPEMHVNEVVDKFVRNSNLVEIKPDLRHFGFNNPNPTDESGYHGYEMWVTIPSDMDVPSPMVKKQFHGGLFAAHMIPFGAFEEWGLLCEWANKNDVYEPNWSETDGMGGCLEEHLNYINHVKLLNSEPDGMQLDLLIPIREKVQL